MPGLRTLQKRMLGYLRQIVNGRPDRPVVRQAYPRLYDSQLETRRVLNADASIVATELLAVLNAGAAANDGHADRFEIAQSSGQGHQEIAVSINGQQVWQGSAREFSHIRLEGSSDQDQFIVDPTINFDGLISIDGGSNGANSPADVLIVLPSTNQNITSVIMEDRLGSIQLQFERTASGPSNTADAVPTTVSGRTVWEVTHVGHIVDYSHAAEHDLLLSRQDEWLLTSTTDSSGNALLQLSSQSYSYEFVAPSDRLSIAAETGSIQISGNVQSDAGSHWNVHANSIVQSGTLRLSPGSSIRMDSGPTGTTVVQGSLIIQGDETHVGGSVIITGHTVRLDAGANIDVSGTHGGGSILVGGDRTGTNPNVRNATYTSIAAGVRLNADATENGHGGRIVVYSLDRTVVGNAADLSARGGSQSGAGGFVETSGRRHLTIQGTPRVSAAAGRAGQWLIDPEAISIVTTVPAIPDPTITYITVTDLLTSINLGGDVILQTTTANPALGDIVIEANISATPGGSARLILQAARNIVFNGSFTGNANLGLHLEAAGDVNTSGHSITGVDHLKIQSGDAVFLDTVTVGAGSTNAGVAIQITAVTSIELAGDLTTAGGSMTLSGPTILADNVILTTSGNSGVLTLGSVDTNGAVTRNLQLTSDSNIATGSINLHGGTLTAQADANNDGVASFTSTGDVTAGIIQLSGSAAKNDSLSALGELKSTVGSITLNNFNLAQLAGDSTSNTDFTTTNINTFALQTGADITSTGAINLDSTVSGVLLGGSSGTQNKLVAQGTSAAINLGPVTSTNANVDLSITSDRGVSLKSITLSGGQVDVLFSQDNPANNSVANFTAAVTSDGLSVTGAGRTNDSVTLSAPLNLGAAGLSVSQVANTQVSGTVTTTTGNISITSTNATTLSVNMTTTGGSITISGPTLLANNIVLTKQGNSGALTVGSVDTSGAIARNLQLNSDSNITTGSVDLHGGTLTAQVDANNDGVASFTSTGDVTAGIIQLSGSAAKNDSLSAQGELKSTVGSITLNNFNLAQLAGDSTSNTDFTATNINTFALQTGADITSTGAINLDSTVTGVLLSGSSGTQNKLLAKGTSAAINLGSVTSTNANVDLSITSDRGVSLKSITLSGGQVDVLFSQDNPANNSVANFTAAVTSDGLSVTGAGRTNDNVTFDAPLNLGAAGLAVSQVAGAQVLGTVTTTTGGLTISVSDTISLSANLTTSGGSITLSGARLLVDGTSARTLSSGNSGTVNTAGSINLSGLTTIDGVGAPADLTIDARGVVTGGTVRLGTISNTLLGLRNLTVDTRGGATMEQLILNNGIAGSTSIVVSGNLSFLNAKTRLNDDVVLTTLENTSTLTLGEVTTDAARSLQLSSDGNIITGPIDLLGGTLTAQVDANNDGVASFTSTGDVTAGISQLSGSAAKNDSLSALGELKSTVGSITLNNFNLAQLAGDSTSNTDFTATNINTLALQTGADITSTGAINLDSTVTSVMLGGSSGTQNKLVAQGTSAAINLGPVTSTNANVDLSITSDRGVSLKSITLSGGQVDVLFSQDNPANNSVANFTAAVTADGLSVTGAGRTNDNVTFGAPLNLGAAGLAVSQVANLQINADINSTGHVAATQISNRIQLVQNGHIQAGSDIDLRTGVNEIQLLGAAGTLNQIISSGDSGTVRLANTISTLGTNLDVFSNHSIVLGAVDLGPTGRLQVEADRNNNNVGSSVTAGNLRATSIEILGSASENDTALLAGTLQSLSGAIIVRQFETITINGDATSATELTVANVSQQLRLGSGVDLLASNGNLTLLPGSGQIVFTGASSTTNVLDARGTMALAALSGATNIQVVLLADGNVQLAGSSLTGSLNVTAGNHAAATGRIETSGRLATSSLTLASATGIGTLVDLLTSTNIVSATNRLSGDIRIDNQSSNANVNLLRTVSGGNIVFHQSDGPATFHQVETFVDATPALNENQIDLQVIGGNLSLSTTGLATDGIGSVRLKTLTTGSVSLLSDLRARNSDVLINSVQCISGTGLIDGKTISLEGTEAIGGATALRTQTTQLTSRTGLGVTNISNTSSAALNVTEMRSLVGGAVRLRQSGGGDALIATMTTGSQSFSGSPSITVINDGASVRVDGLISAGGSGSINLQAQQDLILTNTSRLVTSSETALIEGNAVGQIQFQPGAIVRAGSAAPATEAVMTQLPPLVQVIAVINSIGVNVDTNGLGVIDILLLPSGIGVLDQNYDLTIDWGGGEIDRLPLGPTNANTPATGITRFDASLVAYRITHQYLQNPNTSDPSADIPVRVTAQVDALNRIRFADSTGIDQRFSASSAAVLVVPSTGLVSLYFVLPQTPTIQKQLAFARDNTDAPAPRAVASERSELPISTSTTSSVEQQRKIILRVMTPVDEFGTVEASKDPKDDILLSPEDLADLEGLFARLSDNRYRIYIVMEDGNEVLFKDILLRNHQPAEIEDAPDIREIDRTKIPLLDDTSPVENQPSSPQPESPLSQLPETPTTKTVDRRVDPPEEAESLMVRSWRKAARRFRAG